MPWPLQKAPDALLQERIVPVAAASGLVIDIAWTILGAGGAGLLVMGSQWLADKLQEHLESKSTNVVGETSPLLTKADLENSQSSHEARNAGNDLQPTVGAAGKGGLIAPIILVNMPIILGS
jgi:hypothetical protein|mmetsp:Transcript_23117/g.36945  ORF Transcript_23117/g.36945 Transcript_23117/m.36945 type:complete len:122 (+) Transcript_23117:77-442(+)